jgi:hypothetical protein
MQIYKLYIETLDLDVNSKLVLEFKLFQLIQANSNNYLYVISNAKCMLQASRQINILLHMHNCFKALM